ncbi:uncharacterized protein B0H18DRAFT_160214 [Fomitopsis serialis]|uniref:uncharacterized protein n=1 Tax=Fomitopsis serialis TaxID=139415 RepID=UPI0020084A7C|nr:uncharacterized protein B0H18DRAFT_160214 [Neoantrodia serialis]KAH9930056.1 hypothetical protein B0H18DRAFT_160214 [Neoantrodia serialis]
MDGHSPSRRLHGFSTNRPPPLPAFPESPQARRSRDGSGSESESSSDASGGGPPPRGHQAHPDYATRRPQFASQTQGFRDRRRPSHLHATIYVDDPPYVPREAPPRPPSLRYAPIGGHEQVQHAPVDYRGRALPLPSHTPSTQYSGRRSSSGSPSGSERSQRSQESDDSGNGSERSDESDESSRERPRAVQQVSMAGVFHMHEPLNAPLPFNPERYPAYDAQARRIGLDM